MLYRIIPTAFLMSVASPAAATAQVSEGSSLTLFALGVLGVMIGRRLAIRKSDGDED